MLDCQLFGLNPWGHHLASLLFHLLNTLLLFYIWERMTGEPWRSGVIAFLFALHPLHVESVAWVAERKDVLSTLFWLLTIWTYFRYVQRPGPKRYLLALSLFGLGLLAKPMLVTLPFVLLLLDYWPLSRFHRGQPYAADNLSTRKFISPERPSPLALRLLWEKVPFLALAAAWSLVTFLVQQSNEAVESLDLLPIKIRIANGLVSYVSYIGKMFWPQGLAVFYPHPGPRIQMWQALGAALLLVVIFILVLRVAHRHPYLLVGWLWCKWEHRPWRIVTPMCHSSAFS